MSELKPCHNDLPDRLRWWAAHCDMTSCGCRISSLMMQAADTLERCDQPNQLLGPAKLIPMEEAITILESSNEALVVKMGELAGYIANIEEPDCDVDAGYDTLAYCQREYDAVQMVVDYVRRTQPNEPLTPEELRGMDGEPVWIVAHPDWGHWELSDDAEDYFDGKDEDFYGMTMPLSAHDPMGRYGLHMMGWLAYRSKPKGE